MNAGGLPHSLAARFEHLIRRPPVENPARTSVTLLQVPGQLREPRLDDPHELLALGVQVPDELGIGPVSELLMTLVAVGGDAFMKSLALLDQVQFRRLNGRQDLTELTLNEFKEF